MYIINKVVMKNKVQESVQNNVSDFKNMYNELLKLVIEKRKEAKLSKEFIADWLHVDRRKIMNLEKGKIDVILLLEYADKLSIETELIIKPIN